MNGYDLSRNWFNWCFDNPDKITPNHTALYFFCIEHCNRLGWKEKFGLPTTMAKEAIGIRSYNTYIKTLNDLIDFGFIQIIEKSKNQYSSNIIALSKFNKAHNKALDKALIKHVTKQSESTIQSIDSIDKQETIKQLNNKQENIKRTLMDSFFEDFENSTHFEVMMQRTGASKEHILNNFKEFKKVCELNYPSFDKFVTHFKNWFNKNKTNPIKKNKELL